MMLVDGRQQDAFRIHSCQRPVSKSVLALLAVAQSHRVASRVKDLGKLFAMRLDVLQDDVILIESKEISRRLGIVILVPNVA